ncbi:MAG: nitrate reductase associated protein [Rhizobacter sp.]|jgi:hypothetical protein
MEVQFFEFEAEFVRSLRRVPMIVRFKMDQCGLKLPLRAWNLFDDSVRGRLVVLPTTSPTDTIRYRDFVVAALEAADLPVVTVDVEPLPAWMNRSAIPEPVVRKVRSLALGEPEPALWSNLNPLQRFALTKLTRGSNEHGKFLPALREFGLTV